MLMITKAMKIKVMIEVASKTWISDTVSFIFFKNFQESEFKASDLKHQTGNSGSVCFVVASGDSFPWNNSHL